MRFETKFTHDFIKRELPLRAHRVLEIGCGSGELAASLLQHGLAVVAIDSDCDSVESAQQLGVDARVAAWPDFDAGQFDAVLFTRSLHHIHPLTKAVQRAADSLLASGRLIVEDFAYEAADEKTLRWFGETLDQLDAANLLVKDDDFLNAVRSKTETLKAWRENHEHDLHPAADVFAVIEKVFCPAKREDVPYYFRYLARSIVPTADRDKILHDIAAEEAGLISDGTILPLGRRFVAERSK
jgi:SAM-dependent methyltransferase